MGYWTRIATEHQAINEMMQIQNELLKRLKMAKGVNIVHLGNLLNFWRDFLDNEHMSWEEEIAFALFRKMNHSLVDKLQGDHEKLRNNLTGLEETIKLLRQGTPHSGREYVQLGEEFAETMAGHLSRENTAFKELAAMSGDNFKMLDYPMPTGFRRQKLIGVFSVAEQLCTEYLEKQLALPDWPEEAAEEPTEGEVGEERLTEDHPAPLEANTDLVDAPVVEDTPKAPGVSDGFHDISIGNDSPSPSYGSDPGTES